MGAEEPPGSSPSEQLRAGCCSLVVGMLEAKAGGRRAGTVETPQISWTQKRSAVLGVRTGLLFWLAAGLDEFVMTRPTGCSYRSVPARFTDLGSGRAEE
jgi:hypothetical protein